MTKSYNDIVDEVESLLIEGEPVNCPLTHHFVDGLYCREIFMPAGTVITSKIHKTCHPYIVSQGRVDVIKEDSGIEHIQAPYFGVTTPNTRRVLHVIEDTVWTTIHNVNIHPKSGSEEDMNKAIQEIEDLIILPHVNCVIENKKKKIL